MERTHLDEVAAEPAGNEHFTGSVTMQRLAAVDAPAGTALLVRFDAGARTHWHSHPNGQFLFATEGDGRVATRDGKVARLRPGELVYAPPAEQHWHGGSAGQPVAHLALSFGDTEWYEEVEQTDYESAAG